MQFLIEYGESRFAIVNPAGEAGEPATFRSVATVDYDGRVYAAYLTGEEDEIDPGPDKSNYLNPAEPTAKVFDITDWPVAVPVDTLTEETEFDEDNAPEAAAGGLPV